MSDRAVLKEKNSNSKTGETNHHHGASSHLSQKEEKESKKSKSNESCGGDTFLKRYKIIEKIGEGSYSEVLKCQNRLDGSYVACKRLKHIYKNFCDVSNISEIATLRTIQKHSNILQMIEIHYDEMLGKVSLVFELMDVNLYELIKDRKRLLPESRVRTIMFQLFRALRHLHKLGIFHRDIKPENILIKTKTDQLKLGDLGSVRGMYSRPPYTEYISTRWYRSPECLLTAGHYSHKMDIWAAGCVFYEVLTLRPLFPGSSEIDQINRINNILGPPPMKLLETFQKQAALERDTYRGQSQLNRRQQIQKVLDEYSSKQMSFATDSKTSNKSLKAGGRHSMELHFSTKEGSSLEKILPSHISREAKEIIKACLSYDPEMRPSAQRVIQLSYFYELRESYAKNPEKVSSKPVIIICGETITSDNGVIDLGTLGDNKMKYRRNHLKNSKPGYSLSQSKITSKRSKDSNNNYLKNSSTPEASPTTQQILKCEIDGKGSSKSSKIFGSNHLFNLDQKDRKGSVVDLNNNKIQKSKHSRVAANKLEGDTASHGSTKIPVSKDRSKNSYASKKQKKDKDTTSTSSSFDSLHSNEKNKFRYKYNGTSQPVKSSSDKKGSSLAMSLPPELQLSPYVKAPSELKFLQKKIKGAEHLGKKPSALLHNSSQKENTRVSVIPAKVAAALKFSRAHQNNQRQQQQAHGNVSGERVKKGVAHSPNENKNGKMRFRNKHLHSSKKEVLSSPEETPPKQLPPKQPSKIPVMVDENNNAQGPFMQGSKGQSKQALYRSSKILSPPDPVTARASGGVVDKWKNTGSGIPRVILSPERERNIKLLRESLTIDKNKRLKIRRLEQSAAMDNLETMSLASYGGLRSPKPYADSGYGSKVPPGMMSSAAHTFVNNGRYRNSTTDYENPDMHDTSSASAAPPENMRYNASGSSRKRIGVPPSGEMAKKSSAIKKPSLYPPEIIDIYSSRYRGPDENMNILKDNANYVKHSDRSQDVKEKLNQKLEMRRRHEPGSSSGVVGDHPSKLASEKSSGFMHDYYNPYSKVTLNKSEEVSLDHQLYTNRSVDNARFSRRPPIPPQKQILGMRHAEAGKALQTYREVSEHSNTYMKGNSKRSMMPRTSAGASSKLEKTEAGSKSNRRSVSNVGTAEQIRREYKEQAKRRMERMRTTMRDDNVFCSSDDDIVMTMRKKFDELITERARRLSESLKTNQLEAPKSVRRYYDSDDDTLPSKSKNAVNDRTRKYARRELRARMAESLTMNNIENWRIADHMKGPVLIENPSNNSGDYVVAASSFNDNFDNESNGKNYVPALPPGEKGSYNHSQSQSGYARTSRKDENNNNENYRDKFKPLPQHMQGSLSSRICPFSRHEQSARHGQIYTPPGNKPVYQTQDVGAMLHDRKLRYSHNLPVPVTNSQSNYSQRGSRNFKEISKKRQRI